MRVGIIFIMRTVLVGFFSIGFIALYQRLYNATFEDPKVSRLVHDVRRITLFLFATGLGLALHFGAKAYMLGDTGWFYHNWALFLLTTTFFFAGFSRLEITLQAVALAGFWLAHHAPNYMQPQPLLAVLAFAGLLALITKNHRALMQHWWVGTLGSLALASLFWGSAPVVSQHMTTTEPDRLWAVAMYTVMSACVLGYWLRQNRVDQNHRQLQAVADYAAGSDTYTRYQQAVTAIFNRAKATQTPLTLVSVDLDHFKQINDRYGYLAGNAVLIGVSTTINQTLTHEALSFRLFQTDGEELNIVFENATPQQVLPVVKALRDAVRTSEYTYHERGMTTTVSMGMTALRATDLSIDEAYKRADDAVFIAKRAGRDTICLEKQIIASSEHADTIDYSTYRYFAQGVYDLDSDGTPRYFHELLLRRFSPEQNRWILPDDFEVPVRELPRLLRQAMAASPLHNFNLNLTAAQFEDEDVAQVLSGMMQNGDGPDNLTIEITAVADAEVTRHISALYRSAGIRILIDDVGSDNSFELVRNELAYVDGVKFAMQNLRRTNDAAQMHERIAFWRQVAAENHLSFVLEGIETPDDLQLAENMGVQYVQGYYFGKPEDLTLA